MTKFCCAASGPANTKLQSNAVMLFKCQSIGYSPSSARPSSLGLVGCFPFNVTGSTPSSNRMQGHCRHGLKDLNGLT